MSAATMKELRLKAGLTQTEMASLMGLGKTAYVDLELDDADWKKFKSRHQLALERVSLHLAVERGDISFALPVIRKDALELARLITGDTVQSEPGPRLAVPKRLMGVRGSRGSGKIVG